MKLYVPDTHAVQDFEPAVLNVPAVQIAHALTDEAPAVELKVPAGQGLQDAALDAYAPPGQTHAASEVDPTRLVNPVGH